MNCYSNFLYHFYNIDKKIDNWSIRVEDRKSWKLEHPLQCLRLQTRQFMADGKNRWLRPAPKSLVKYRKKCLIAMDKASFRGSDIPCFFFSWPWPNWDLELPCCRKASLWEIWWEPRYSLSCLPFPDVAAVIRMAQTTSSRLQETETLVEKTEVVFKCWPHGSRSCLIMTHSEIQWTLI